MALTFAFVLGLTQLQFASAASSLSIDTSSGSVQGFLDDITPNVAQYLGIPFAEQPVGARRWLPPVPKSKENATIQAKHLGPACPQFERNEQNTYLTDAPEFIISPRDYQAEDCLHVNVWAPWDECQRKEEVDEPLPVIIWIHGGSFVTGGSTVEYQNPARWVERSRKHIVVGLK
jgi:acetylcholinesterase